MRRPRAFIWWSSGMSSVCDTVEPTLPTPRDFVWSPPEMPLLAGTVLLETVAVIWSSGVGVDAEEAEYLAVLDSGLGHLGDVIGGDSLLVERRSDADVLTGVDGVHEAASVLANCSLSHCSTSARR